MMRFNLPLSSVRSQYKTSSISNGSINFTYSLQFLGSSGGPEDYANFNISVLSASGVPLGRENNITTTFGSWSGYIILNGTSSFYIVTVSVPLFNAISATCFIPPQPVLQLPISFTNSQTAGTAAPFQQMLVFNSKTYSQYEAGNLDNIRFSYTNGTVLPSWMEYDNKSGNSTYWLKIGPGIPGLSSITVYMDFFPTNDNVLNTLTTGEAPQLSPVYGEYDDGAHVFTFYDDFKNSTSLSSLTLKGNSTVTANDGLLVSSSAGEAESVITPGFTFSNSSTPNGGYATDALFGSLPSGAAIQYTDFGWGPYCSPGPGHFFSYLNSTSAQVYGISGTYAVPNSNNIILSASVTAGSSAYSINYKSIASGGGYGSSMTDYAAFVNYCQGASSPKAPSTFNYPDLAYWTDVRAAPPNDVMPSVLIAPLITTFTESGLPSGYTWHVTYDSVQNNPTTTSTTFTTSYGNYSYSVNTLSNSSGGCTTTYTPSPSSGSLYSGLSQSITFSASTACINYPSTPVFTASGSWNPTTNNVQTNPGATIIPDGVYGNITTNDGWTAQWEQAEWEWTFSSSLTGTFYARFYAYDALNGGCASYGTDVTLTWAVSNDGSTWTNIYSHTFTAAGGVGSASSPITISTLGTYKYVNVTQYSNTANMACKMNTWVDGVWET